MLTWFGFQHSDSIVRFIGSQISERNYLICLVLMLNRKLSECWQIASQGIPFPSTIYFPLALNSRACGILSKINTFSCRCALCSIVSRSCFWSFATKSIQRLTSYALHETQNKFRHPTNKILQNEWTIGKCFLASLHSQHFANFVNYHSSLVWAIKFKFLSTSSPHSADNEWRRFAQNRIVDYLFQYKIVQREFKQMSWTA